MKRDGTPISVNIKFHCPQSTGYHFSSTYLPRTQPKSHRIVKVAFTVNFAFKTGVRK
jgi:hypothetical protein